MKSFIAFTKKEFLELFRTYKILIILAVFLVFSMMNPIIAKITPLLVENFMPAGMNITIPEPSAMDSWMQFYKNLPLCLIVFVIVFSGILTVEISNGTLINMLTKGLRRANVIISKLLTMLIMWTFAYLLYFMVTYVYTIYLFPENINNIIYAALMYYIFGILIISVMIFASSMFNSNYGVLLFTGGVTVILFLINIVPKIQKYNPLMLINDNMSLLQSKLSVGDFKFALMTLTVMCFVFIISAIPIFNKKQI
ncbi:ABC transporter permease [Anaerofustis stercorihominis]|uniref:ABC-2 type transporter n=1 Tax=Anaerofustis stercorihominis DSM 17244 TaxID=445971 RepID=B1CBA3_9FIRM|nr:ABC transporter permease [Anaerofustis stercorihominis]EDS71550.1 hypothetical protein ANASTE_01252 [Anaerofustis stercorihominis DSM 17244]